MTPQQRSKKQKQYRKKRFLRGQCQRCPSDRMKGRVLCEPCTIGRRYHQRRYINAKPWIEGFRGRPPKYKDTNNEILFKMQRKETK